MRKFGLTLNVAINTEICDCLNHSYVNFFSKLDIIPILIPNSIQKPTAFFSLLDLDGLILTGGNDIYDSKVSTNNVQTSFYMRDELEFELLDVAIRKGVPVLGICRGMQILNKYFGGGLQYDLLGSGRTSHNHAGRPHSVRITNSAVAAVLSANEIEVNSFHNHGVPSELVATQLDTFAVCKEDDLVEGIIHPKEHILGIQWHPERPGGSISADMKIISSLISGRLWESRTL